MDIVLVIMRMADHQMGFGILREQFQHLPAVTFVRMAVARTAPERDMAAENDHLVFGNVRQIPLEPFELPVVESGGEFLVLPQVGDFAMKYVIHRDDVYVAAVKRIVLRSEILLKILDALPVGRRHAVIRFVQMIVVADRLEERHAAGDRRHGLLHSLPDGRAVIVGNVAQRNAIDGRARIPVFVGGFLQVGNRLVLETGETLFVAALRIGHAEKPELRLLAVRKACQFEILAENLDAKIDFPIKIGQFRLCDHRTVNRVIGRRRVEDQCGTAIAHQLVDAVRIGRRAVEAIADNDTGNSGPALHVVDQTAERRLRSDIRAVDMGHIFLGGSARSFRGIERIVAAREQQRKNQCQQDEFQLFHGHRFWRIGPGLLGRRPDTHGTIISKHRFRRSERSLARYFCCSTP